MSETESAAKKGAGGGARLTMAAALLVLLLAVGAMFWPESDVVPQAHALLVFDSSGDQARIVGVFEPLREYLAGANEDVLELVVVRTVGEFRERLAGGPDFILAHDGLALQVPAENYLPLVAGRRAAPRNLRPRSVLVYRRSAGDVPEPWRTVPRRTVFGDSVSLASVGVLRTSGQSVWPAACSSGPDPFDHGPALHALRLGGFDYAVVRQWDAERFFATGLLTEGQYAVRGLVAPVPDAVLMVSRRLPRHVRLRCGEGLSTLGRHGEDEGPREAGLRRALAGLRLVGFNLLVEPDFELVRKNYAGDWLPAKD